MNRRIQAGVVLFAALFATLGLRAQTVSVNGLFNTGVDGSGVKLVSNDVADTHWVVSLPAGSSAPADNAGSAKTVTSLGSGWVANPTDARWVTTPGTATNGTGSGGGNTRRTAGNFDYTLTFTMNANADLTSVSITGSFATDDSATIYVNGTLVSGQGGGKAGGTTAFTLNDANANFTSGTNTITFRVNNATNKSDSGLLVTGISGSVWVPETGAFLPAAAALAVGIASAYRLRRGRK